MCASVYVGVYMCVCVSWMVCARGCVCVYVYMFVYTVRICTCRGLRLEAPYNVSPCKADTSSRWLKAQDTACAKSVLDSKTEATLRDAIQGGTCSPVTLTPTDGKSLTSAKWTLVMDNPNADNTGT